MKRASLWALTLLIAIPLIACSSDPDEPIEEDFGSLSIDNQVLEEADEITVAEVVSVGEGEIVIHEDDGGEAADELGRLDVDDGESSDLTVELDRAIDGEEALLGSLLDSDGDLAIDEEGDAIVVHFTATYDDEQPPVLDPSITIDDQTADPADEIVVAEVVAAEDGEVVIYEDDDGDAGEELGSASVDAGEDGHTDLVVTLDRDAEDGEMLHGKLTDGEGDVVTDEDDNEIADSFTVTVEDEEVVVSGTVAAHDQFISDEEADMVEIAMASIEGADGWVVIHEDDDGEAGDILGYTFLEEGDDQQFHVTLDDDLEGEGTLHAMLHADLPADEEFTHGDDAEEDPPVLDEGENVVVVAFDYEIVDLGAIEIQVSDQTLESPPLDVVTIDAVVYAESDGWVVIFDDQDQVIGHTHLDDPDTGVYNDVEVTLDDEIEGETDLRAQLHEDVETEGEFSLGDDPQVELAGDPVEGDFTVDLLPNEISVSDQDIDGSIDDIDAKDSSLVITLDEVQTRHDVVVEIFADDDDGHLLGAASFDYGIHAEVDITLDRPLEDGEALTAEMIAIDDEESLVEESFDVTVADGTPALYFTAEHDDDWSFTVEPSAYQDLIDGDADPALTLYQDWRFQFRNMSTASHPLEFIHSDTGGLPVVTPPSEDIHLSQATEGEYENEPEVDWREEGDSRFAFTLADILVSSDLNAYQDDESESGGDVDTPEAPELEERGDD